MSRLNRIFIALIAVTGVIISIQLINVYYNANFNPDVAPSFCAVNEFIDCDAVAETEYSRFLNVPLALWGLGFYSFILLIALFPFHKFEIFRDFKHPKSYIFVLATLSVIVSLFLFYISYFIIEKVCLLCQNLYLVNGALFVTALMGGDPLQMFKNALNDIKNILTNETWYNLAIILGMLGVIALILISIYKPFNPIIPESNKKPVIPQKTERLGNILGDKEAEIVIHEYTDYECPYCAVSNSMMIRLSKDIDGIRIQHHDYPLNSECNPLVQRSIHPHACTAIYYAKAAKKQGKFWDLATLLYENRKNLSENNILNLAEQLGMDIEQLKKDAQNIEKYNKEIEEDIMRAKSMGINGTPSYVIGIRKYEGIMPYNELKQKVLEIK